MHTRTLLPIALAAAVSAQAPPPATANLTAALAGVPELSNLTSTLGLFEELVAAVASAPNLTLLAPSNKAFEDFLASDQAAALNDTDLVQAVLSYHVLNGSYPSSAVTETPAFIPTLLTNETYTNVTGGQVVQVVKDGDNVVIFSGLGANSTVTQADIQYNNGVIHIIDSLLTIPANVSATAIASNLTAAAGALTAADLVEAVDTTPDITVFAPNNEAFAAIGSALSNISTEDLASVLTYHVINGTVAYSSTLENGTTVPTLNGADVTITIDGEDVFVNGAKVILADVLVANGVVHVIDSVLNPANSTATPDDDEDPDPAFSGASSVTDVPYTSGVGSPTGAGGAASETASASPSNAGPIQTAAIGAAALFGAGAAMYNM